MSASWRLAVYGLLRPERAGWHKFGLAQRTLHIGPCRIAGRLFDVGGHPGLVAGEGTVLADLLESDDAALLAELDAFEDYDPAHPDRGEYVRRTVTLSEPAGTAEVYFYNREFASFEHIIGGDWLAFTDNDRR